MAGAPEKLKLGLVSPYSWTSQWGVNRHIRGLAASLAANGHDVSIIAPAEERDEARVARRRARASRKAAPKRQPHQPGEAHPYNPHENVNGKNVHLLKVAGTFRVPYSESLANLALPLEVTARLEEILSGSRFDILHLHEPYPPSLSFTALRLARSPAVATFHTAGERFLSYQLMRPVVERFFSRLDGRICTSHSTRRIISGYFPANYEVVGDGVDTATYFPHQTGRGLDRGLDDVPLVLFAAWSDPRKSLGLLLRTMRLLPPDLPPFKLAIVGGEDLAWRAGLIVPRRLRERAFFQGTVAPGEIATAYRRAEVLCAPYAGAGLSAAILEAMATGNAIIAPGRAGIRELVGEGSEGLLLDQPYSYNLAANLVDLLLSPRLRRSLGASAARKARQHSWQKIAAGVEAAYTRAHGRRGSRTRKQVAGALDANRTILADLHMHTSFSKDCATTPEDLLAACQECGLEAIAVTDHNTIAGALEVARLAPAHMQVIAGEEIKTTAGEIIGLFLEEEIPRGLSIAQTILRIKGQGGLVYVPHPFDPLHLTPTYESLASNAADIDIIEVYNPRITFSSFNEKARRLALKYNIPGGAGSDCHVLQGVGTAMLSLRKFRTPAELLASLRSADIIRSSKSPLYLHSLKLLKSSRGARPEE